VDRPGYGESTFQPGRRILDLSGDISQLADHLGIDSFAVAGHSGGGPYALVCAHQLPGRVCKAAVLSGAGQVDAQGATLGMTPLNWFGFKFGQYIPWPLGRLIAWIVFHERCADPAKALDHETGHRPPADDKLMAKLEIRQICLESELEAFRPGMLGFAWDIRLITRPWGFRLEDILVPVYLWHGTSDNLTSIPMARNIASRIPNCKITICENEAHLLLFPHWEEILTQLSK
jgi:pimeloyl-ACP methyl ester carboxylesterase